MYFNISTYPLSFKYACRLFAFYFLGIRKLVRSTRFRLWKFARARRHSSFGGQCPSGHVSFEPGFWMALLQAHWNARAASGRYFWMRMRSGYARQACWLGEQNLHNFFLHSNARQPCKWPMDWKRIPSGQALKYRAPWIVSAGSAKSFEQNSRII